MKKQPVIQKKNSKVSQSVSSQKPTVIFTNGFLLKGNVLHPLTQDKFNSSTSVERKFRSAREFEQLVSLNYKTLFGQKTFFIPFPSKAEGLFGKGFDPVGFLLDLSDQVKPKFYVVEIQLASQDFYAKNFARINRFVSYFINQNSFETLYKLVSNNNKVQAELKARMKTSEIADYLAGTIVSRSFILFVTDSEIKELSEVLDIYKKELQRVKTIFIRKFSNDGNTVCTIVPHFSELYHNGKKRTPNAPVTEEYHLEGATDGVKGAYKKFKAELLKVNNQLQFNPQKYYISLKKNRNLAFFHISRKKISLVVMNPEKDTKKQIKHHEVKTLTEKVQKFWNGPSCTIMIENEKHLQEVISLLKKLVRS